MKVTGCVLGQYFAWSKVKERKRQRNNMGSRQKKRENPKRQRTKQTSGLRYNATWVSQRLYVFMSEKFLVEKMRGKL